MPDEPVSPGRNLWSLIRAGYDHERALLRVMLGPNGLTVVEYRVLLILGDAEDTGMGEGACFTQDLLRGTGADPSILSRAVQRLEKAGLVTMSLAPVGQRRHGNSRIVRLTQSGVEMNDRLELEHEAMAERVLAGVSDEHLAAHLEVVGLIRAELGKGAAMESSYGMLTARQLIEDTFSPDEDAPRPDRAHKRFNWTPPGPKARTQQGGPDDGAELPPDPAAPVSQLDDPTGATEMSHAELLAQGGMDRELWGDDVLDLFNQSKTYKGPNRAATAAGRAGFKGQTNRLRGYAGFGEAEVQSLVNQLLDA